MNLYDPKSISGLLANAGIRPTRGKGQNFLIDQNVIKKIIAAADLKPEDNVLEIGPGLGVLTKELATSAGRVLTVELDKKIIEILKRTIKGQTKVEILAGDILKIKNEEIAAKLGKDYKIVANLPYAITGPILRKFLSYNPKPTEMIVMVQKEVAERICAGPGKMSVLAISVQLYGEPEVIFGVGKGSFYPVPEVDSAVLRISSIKGSSEVLTARLQGVPEKKFWQLVKIGFSSRRKQLQNNLAAGFKISNTEAKNRLIQAKISPLIRAQDLTVEHWITLAKFF